MKTSSHGVVWVKVRWRDVNTTCAIDQRRDRRLRLDTFANDDDSVTETINCNRDDTFQSGASGARRARTDRAIVVRPRAQAKSDRGSWWPASEVSDRTAAIERLGELALRHFEKRSDARVFQYFGSGGSYELEKTSTACVAWEEGLEHKYHQMKPLSAKRAKAIENAFAFAERGDLSAEIEANVVWWSEPLLPPIECVEEVAVVSRRKRSREAEVNVEADDVETPVNDGDEFKFPIAASEFRAGVKRTEYTPPLSVLSMGKPAAYERINRSTFVSVPPPVKMHISESATCECKPPLRDGGGTPTLRNGCGPECINRKLRFSCDSRTCPCGDACSNRPLSQLPTPKTKIIRTENRGWGLMLQEPVTAGTFIVEYTGEILNEADVANRLWLDKQEGEENFYLMEISTNYVIDAKFKGALARFINSGCHPNCETQRWVDASTNETRVGIFAIEDIPAGTELTYDYHFAHFGDASATSFVCMCGHPKCRGTLDAAKREAHFHRRIRVEAMLAPKSAGPKARKKKQYVKGTIVDHDRAKNRYKVEVDASADEAERVCIWVRLEGEGAAKHAWLK